MVDEDLATFTDFDLTATYATESACHTLYRPDGMWIGHVFKDFEDEDWQIALTGELNVRGAWPDFWIATDELLQWRKQVDAEKVKELQECRSWKVQEDTQPAEKAKKARKGAKTSPDLNTRKGG